MSFSEEMESMMWEILDEEAEDSRARPEAVSNVAMGKKVEPTIEEKPAEPIDSVVVDAEGDASSPPWQPGVPDTASSVEPPVAAFSEPLPEEGGGPSGLDVVETEPPVPSSVESGNTEVELNSDPVPDPPVSGQAAEEIPLVDHANMLGPIGEIGTAAGEEMGSIRPSEIPDDPEVSVLPVDTVDFDEKAMLPDVWTNGEFGDPFVMNIPDDAPDNSPSASGESFWRAVSERRYL
jgi:hypothetical protein